MWWIVVLWVILALIAILFVVYTGFRIAKNNKLIKKQRDAAHKLRDSIRKLQELEQKAKEQTDYANVMLTLAKEDVDRKCEENKELENQVQLAKQRLESTIAQDDMLKQQYDGKIQLLNESYKVAKEKADAKTKDLDDAFRHLQENLEASYKDKEELLKVELGEWRAKIEQEHQTFLVAQEQNRSAAESENLHFLQLGKNAVEELKELNGVCAKLSNPLPLYKAIYEVFYKVPLSTLVNDLQVRGKTGIYKISNAENGKIYVGQSVDIGER